MMNKFGVGHNIKRICRKGWFFEKAYLEPIVGNDLIRYCIGTLERQVCKAMHAIKDDEAIFKVGCGEWILGIGVEKSVVMIGMEGGICDDVFWAEIK